jgi:hypothetical protein
MDHWLTRLSADTSNDPRIVKIRSARPADPLIADARSGAAEDCRETDAQPGELVRADLPVGFTRVRLPERRSPATSNASLPVDPADYRVVFASDEMGMRKIFSTGGATGRGRASSSRSSAGPG